jgi:hypothetical protein
MVGLVEVISGFRESSIGDQKLQVAVYVCAGLPTVTLARTDRAPLPLLSA